MKRRDAGGRQAHLAIRRAAQQREDMPHPPANRLGRIPAKLQDDARQVVGILRTGCEWIGTDDQTRDRVRSLVIFGGTLDQVRSNADSVRGDQPSATRRAVTVLPVRSALAPQVDPIDLTLDHLEISVKWIDPRVVEEHIRHGIAADQGERLLSTPARRLPLILDLQIEGARGATCLEEFVHGHHSAAARPRALRRP